jgi:septum formation protein
VWRRLAAQGEKPDLVIGSDTIVAHGGMILEKPRDETHAFDMLKGECSSLPIHRPIAIFPSHVHVSPPADLSGTSHEVFSGVALLCPPQGSQGGEPEECCFVEMTKVNFAPLEDATIKAYVASGEPMDKAGGYGIQVSASIPKPQLNRKPSDDTESRPV